MLNNMYRTAIHIKHIINADRKIKENIMYGRAQQIDTLFGDLPQELSNRVINKLFVSIFSGAIFAQTYQC